MTDHVPPVVKQQADAAAALEQSLRTKPAGTASVAAPSGAPAPSSAAPTAPVAAVAPKPSAPAVPSAALDGALKAENDRLKAQLEDLQKRGRERDGKLGGELDAIRRDLQQQQETVARLLRENAELRGGKSTPETTATPAPGADLGLENELLALVPQDAQREFGIGLYQSVARMIRVAIERLLPTHMQPVAKRFEDLEAEAAEARFWLLTESRAPGAKTINDEAATNGFGDYLDEPIPGGFGVTRRQVAERAAAAGDFARMAEVINGFVNKTPATNVPAPTPPLAEEPPTPIESLVDGGGAGGGGVAPKPVLTMSAYNAYFGDVSAHRIRPTEAEHNARVAEFDAAIREGRFDYTK